MSEDEVNKFFNSVEIDKNGYLDYREFIHFWMNNEWNIFEKLLLFRIGKLCENWWGIYYKDEYI